MAPRPAGDRIFDLGIMTLRRFLDEIRSTHRSYLEFPRHDGDARAILAAKLEATYWRHRMSERILAAAEAGEGDGSELTEALLALNVHLDEGDLQRVRALLDDDDLYGQVLAQQGVRWPGAPQHHLTAGPGMDLKIEANRDSPWSLEKWQALPTFSDYRFEGNTLHYRGLELRAGDVILANVNLDGNFVYSALSDPKAVYTHSAVLVFLRQGDRRFPAVVETYEKGVRAIPLAIFLNARFLAHAEIYRHRDIGEEHAEALGTAAAAMVRDTLGYNCASWDDDRSYLSCTSVGRFLFEDVDVAPPHPLSTITDPQIVENLRRVGYRTFTPFFAPVDYLLNPLFRIVGVVDNNQIYRLLARELVERRFRTQFAAVPLEPRLLPFSFRINRFALQQIRARTVIGRMVGRAIGFTHTNLPKGPDAMMAGIQPAEQQFARAVRVLIPEMRRYLEGRDDFRFETLMADDGVRALVDRTLRPPWLVR